MKLIAILILCLVLCAAPASADAVPDSVESTTYTLLSCEYSVPDTLSIVFRNEDEFTIHAIDEDHTITVMCIPFDDLSAILSDDLLFSDMCAYIHETTYGAGGTEPEVATPPDSPIKAALIAANEEIYFYAADHSAFIIVASEGYSTSEDIQAAFLHVISSVKILSDAE